MEVNLNRRIKGTVEAEIWEGWLPALRGLRQRTQRCAIFPYSEEAERVAREMAKIFDFEYRLMENKASIGKKRIGLFLK